jgi:hypothetical protein
MVLEDRAFDKFLRVAASFCISTLSPTRKTREQGREGTTHAHGKFIIRKQNRHKVKEMIVVFVQLDRFEGYLRQKRFDTRWELAFVVPVLCVADPH